MIQRLRETAERGLRVRENEREGEREREREREGERERERRKNSETERERVIKQSDNVPRRDPADLLIFMRVAMEIALTSFTEEVRPLSINAGRIAFKKLNLTKR